MLAQASLREEEREANLLAPTLSQMDESAKKEYWATLVLRHCAGLGARSRAKLLKKYKFATAALDNYKYWPTPGISNLAKAEIAAGKWRRGAKKEWDEAIRSRARVILWKSDVYPARLRELPDAPGLLYCAGDIELLRGPAVAIVGSRIASPQNLTVAQNLAKALADFGLTVVSGMASGVDKAAHCGALAGVGKSVGVLGAGITVRYPSSNRDLYDKMSRSGLLLSEFSPYSPPAAYNFPIRNRIISGLALGVVVVEAAAKSGSLITARLALEQNREVFAVPGQALNERSMGCNNLLRQGARPVFSAEDILRDLHGELRNFPMTLPGDDAPKKGNVSAENAFLNVEPSVDKQSEQAALSVAPQEDGDLLIAALRDGPLSADELAAKLDLSPEKLSPLLLGLEIRALIKRLPGARYALRE